MSQLTSKIGDGRTAGFCFQVREKLDSREKFSEKIFVDELISSSNFFRACGLISESFLKTISALVCSKLLISLMLENTSIYYLGKYILPLNLLAFLIKVILLNVLYV